MPKVTEVRIGLLSSSGVSKIEAPEFLRYHVLRGAVLFESKNS